MLFNSSVFLIFFSIVLIFYFLLQGRLTLQNRMLLIASYVFYGWWDWRFLSLIWLSTAVDYFCGLMIDKEEHPSRRKFFLTLSLCFNLGLLGFFKYFNFFTHNFEEMLHAFGFQGEFPVLRIILPAGISFYTFQEISYIVDVYRKDIRPIRNFFDYALFVVFFPQLVAGPILRAVDFLPQILRPRKVSLDTFYEGCYLVLWGLYKKMFVADNLSKIVNSLFSSPPPYQGGQVLIGVYAFSFQIYCDFSGYSDIARGIAKMMGFELMLNFNLPYFAANPSDFWRRWHISLSTWLRDYLYVPLGGNRKGSVFTYRNLMLTMVLGGLWHGAAWTFVVWGVYHGFLLCAYRFLEPLLKSFPEIRSRLFRNFMNGMNIIFFFHLTCLGWLFFRAESLSQGKAMLYALFSGVHFSAGMGLKSLMFYISLLLAVQCLQYVKKNLMAVYEGNFLLKTAVYAIVFYSLGCYGVTTGTEFIYFQF